MTLVSLFKKAAQTKGDKVQFVDSADACIQRP